MKKLLTILAISLLPVTAVSQVKSRISTRTGTVNQLEAYGRVLYQGLGYYPEGRDSLFIRNNGTKTDSITIPSVLTIDKKPYTVAGFKDNAFEYDVDLKYISIPSSITEIASSCFYGCSRLKECDMPGVKTIGAYSFFGTDFHSLAFSEGLERIDECAFKCDNLRYIELPGTLEYIGERAFVYCEQLDTVKVHFDKPIELGSSVFWLNRRNTSRRHKTLMVPAGSRAAFEAHEQWRLFQTIIEY